MIVSRQCGALRAGLFILLEEFVESVAGPLQSAGFLVAPVASLLHRQNSELETPAAEVAVPDPTRLASVGRQRLVVSAAGSPRDNAV